MSVYKTSKKIFLATRTLNRVSQILSVLSKHGLSFLVEQMGLLKYLPIKSRLYVSADSQSIPERLRLAFEELGPVFVKLGQLISMREDIFGPEWTHPMRVLQDNVKPFLFEEVVRVLKEKHLYDKFSFIDESPLASGSIAQVHRATLVGGESVVIKIRRPQIESAVDLDGLVLEYFVSVLEKQIPDLQIFGLSRLVEEFIIDLKNELNFKIEAGYIERISKNASNDQFLKIPQLFSQHSDESVLVEEFIDGIPFGKVSSLSQSTKDLICRNGLRSIMRMILKDGIFHGDLHNGNLFILPNNRIGLIDFGSVGVLSSHHRALLLSMLQHILNEEFENVVSDFMEMAGRFGGVDTAGLSKDLRTTLSPWMGLGFEKVDHGKLLLKATQLAGKYQIQIPSDWYLVFKAIANLEAMAKVLNPQFNLIEEAKVIGLETTMGSYSWTELTQTIIQNSHDVLELIKIVPRELKWFLKFWEHNNYKIPVVIQHGDELNKNILNIGRAFLSFFVGCFVISVSLYIRQEINFYLMIVLLGIGIVFILRSIRSFK